MRVRGSRRARVVGRGADLGLPRQLLMQGRRPLAHRPWIVEASLRAERCTVFVSRPPRRDAGLRVLEGGTTVGCASRTVTGTVTVGRREVQSRDGLIKSPAASGDSRVRVP